MAKPPKQPPPPHYARNTKARKALIKEVERHSTTIIQQTIDTNSLKKQVQNAITGEMSKQMGSLKEVAEEMTRQVGDLKQMVATEVAKAILANSEKTSEPALDPALLAETIETTMRSVLEKLPQIQRSGEKSREPDEPIYIPTGIVEKDTKGKVDVQVSASERTDLEDASAALKALKQRKQKDGDGS